MKIVKIEFASSVPTINYQKIFPYIAKLSPTNEPLLKKRFVDVLNVYYIMISKYQPSTGELQAILLTEELVKPQNIEQIHDLAMDNLLNLQFPEPVRLYDYKDIFTFTDDTFEYLVLYPSVVLHPQTRQQYLENYVGKHYVFIIPYEHYIFFAPYSEENIKELYAIMKFFTKKFGKHNLVSRYFYEVDGFQNLIKSFIIHE